MNTCVHRTELGCDLNLKQGYCYGKDCGFYSTEVQPQDLSPDLVDLDKSENILSIHLKLLKDFVSKNSSYLPKILQGNDSLLRFITNIAAREKLNLEICQHRREFFKGITRGFYVSTTVYDKIDHLHSLTANKEVISKSINSQEIDDALCSTLLIALGLKERKTNERV